MASGLELANQGWQSACHQQRQPATSISPSPSPTVPPRAASITISDGRSQFELYNLREDPTQESNLYAEQIDRAKAMRAVLERFQSEGRSVPRREMDKK